MGGRSHRPGIAAAQWTSQRNGRLPELENSIARLHSWGVPLRTFTIDPLRTDWHAPVAADHFRSGCAPLEALEMASGMILEEREEAVLIQGHDNLRSDYSREERLRQMAIYSCQTTLPEAYDALADRFFTQRGWSQQEFHDIRDALFDNCLRTFHSLGKEADIDARWFAPLTRHFRGVDCANPLLDFNGGLLVTSKRWLDRLEIATPIEIMAVKCARHLDDGPEHISQISRYSHLRECRASVEEEADCSLQERLWTGDMRAEAYSCYPVVPLAFLEVVCGATSPREMHSWISRIPMTLGGGLNLAKAPWNNPALRALVEMVSHLRTPSTAARLGLVHGNGGLGYRQGLAILGRNN